MIGQTLGHYCVLEQIGAGGMGLVFRAHDERLDRDVALKVLPSGTLTDENARKRFRKEALTLSKLNHPNIETVFDFDTQGGVDFLVMELIPGVSLDEKLAAGALLEKEVVRLGTQLAEGLAAAHAEGVIHRDLKPGNLRLTPDGRLKILDFGLAKLIQPIATDAATESLSQTRGAVGTLPYMAPEQLRGEPADARSDIWAAGAVLYELATGRRPFPQSSPPMLTDAILRQVPVPARVVNADLSPELERIITKALEKDSDLRYQHAADIRTDLQRFTRNSSLAASTETPSAASPRRLSVFGKRVLALAAMAAASLIALISWWVEPRKVSPPLSPSPTMRTVAVLPFQNVGSDKSIDFLRFALPDELATILSHTRSLSIRPFATTSKYVEPNLDLQKAGQEMRVASIVTGHFLKEGEQLEITLEAVEVEGNRLLWRDTLNVPAQNMIAMQEQIAAKARGGLAPVLGSSVFATDTAVRPRNEEAYDLYLRSAAVPNDPAPNKQAIGMLERAVGLDSTYAPAWAALALRYYIDSADAGGGDALMKRSDAAAERALTLDPNFIAAGAQLTRNRVERGELAKAYQEAEDLVRRRPDNAEAHFTLGYVLRYAGLLQESASQCDTALSLDPGTFRWRSCALVFLQRGEYQRAIDYLRLDLGSEFYKGRSIDVLVRTGKEKEALQIGQPDIASWRARYGLLLACAGHRPLPEIAALSRGVHLEKDPEENYLSASDLAYCGQTEAALQMLRRAIEGNYCSYPAIDSDPLFASIRRKPEFGEVRSAAINCQKKFLAERGQITE